MSRKILYVDDELDSRAIVAGHLRFRGYEVLTVEQAPHALRTAAETPPDAIVLDVNLIGMDGPELFDQFQQHHPGVPVILYTGMDRGAPKINRMLAMGGCQYLSKKEPLDALTVAVSTAIRTREEMAR
jgi:DNA-binding NtrC family response regulator